MANPADLTDTPRTRSARAPRKRTLTPTAMLGSLVSKVSDQGMPLAIHLWNGEQVGAEHPRVTLNLRQPLDTSPFHEKQS